MSSRCRSIKRFLISSAGNGNGTSQRAGTTSSKRLWRTRGHILEAILVRRHPVGEVARYNWRATYRCTVQGEERKYSAYFKHPATPPLRLYLYYIDNPKKLFSYEEYHYENHKALLLFPLIFLPWILAGIALALLGVDFSGF